MDRGAWQATVHRVTKSWTLLSMHTLPNDPKVILRIHLTLGEDEIQRDVFKGTQPGSGSGRI